MRADVEAAAADIEQSHRTAQEASLTGIPPSESSMS